MNRLLLATLLAGFASVASAQSVGTATQPVTPDPIHSDATTRDVRDHTCLRETGSVIAAAQNRRALREARARGDENVTVQCAAYGRAYTQDDIRRTGGMDVADSLRQLDPAIH